MESIDTRYLLHKDDICNALNKNKGTSEKKINEILWNVLNRILPSTDVFMLI